MHTTERPLDRSPESARALSARSLHMEPDTPISRWRGVSPVSPPRRGPLQVRRLQAGDVRWLPALADLLIDSVHQGASLGFLAPMSRYQAMDHWHGVFARLGRDLQLWVACESEGRGPLQGAVLLHQAQEPAAHHRGEPQHLMVHSQERGRGIASQLLAALEAQARLQGLQLLVLKAPADSQAEAVFTHLGWQRSGQIPAHGSCAEGSVHDTALMFKKL